MSHEIVREKVKLLKDFHIRVTEKQKEHMRAFAESCKENNYSKKNGFFKKRK